MVSMNEFPEIMRHAHVDLLSNVSGRFSPEDWQKILQVAREKLDERAAQTGDPIEAWRSVILDFNRNQYWGFYPDYAPGKDLTRKRNYGLEFLALAFLAFTVTKVALAWLGQIYTRSDEPVDAYIFFAAIALI